MLTKTNHKDMMNNSNYILLFVTMYYAAAATLYICYILEIYILKMIV